MLKILTNNKLELTEENFSKLLPQYLQRSSDMFFTPIRIATTAAQWLTEDGKKRVLDIGAGVGKFCITGAKYTDSYFYGIEYRPSLVEIANEIIDQFGLANVSVHAGDMMDVDFQSFDAFYLFNPFCENLFFNKRLNDEVELFDRLYIYYFQNTRLPLSQTKPGTRLVTYYGNGFEVPESFKKIKEAEGCSLKLWIQQ